MNQKIRRQNYISRKQNNREHDWPIFCPPSKPKTNRTEPKTKTRKTKQKAKTKNKNYNDPDFLPCIPKEMCGFSANDFISGIGRQCIKTFVSHYCHPVVSLPSAHFFRSKVCLEEIDHGLSWSHSRSRSVE